MHTITFRNEVVKVMFLHLSVILFTGGGGGVPAPGRVCLLGGVTCPPPSRYTPWAGTPPYTPLRAGTPPLGQIYPPWAGTPPRAGTPPTPGRRLLLRTVRILLECILILCNAVILLHKVPPNILPMLFCCRQDLSAQPLVLQKFPGEN